MRNYQKKRYVLVSCRQRGNAAREQRGQGSLSVIATISTEIWEFFFERTNEKKFGNFFSFVHLLSKSRGYGHVTARTGHFRSLPQFPDQQQQRSGAKLIHLTKKEMK